MPVFVFDASPLIAGCSFWFNGISVAELVLAGAQVWIPPAVHDEVVVRGGSRRDALEAARLIHQGQIRLATAAEVGVELPDLHHYSLGQGDKESLALTERLEPNALLVTDDFLALVLALRLGLPHQLFLDFIVSQAVNGGVSVLLAKQAVPALNPRYPRGFVPHALAMLDRLTP